MNPTTSPLGPISLPTASSTATPTPPARWARWWTSPIAHFEYGSASRVPFWADAVIPAERNLTGALRPALVFGGSSKAEAIAAARLLAQQPTEIEFSFRNGRFGSTQVAPAIAVLRDATAGAYWLAPLRTTVRRGDQWLDAPHTIDGAAFTGDQPLLSQPRVLSATSVMVAVVGAETIVTPEKWVDAPHDSKLTRS